MGDVQAAHSPLASSCLSPGLFSSQTKRHAERIGMPLPRQMARRAPLSAAAPSPPMRIRLENLSLSKLALCSQFLPALPGAADVGQGCRLRCPKERSSPSLRGALLCLQLDPSGQLQSRRENPLLTLGSMTPKYPYF